jgi:hypothetical protein
MKNVLRKFVRNRRAVTPVLSELLLTVIAVAAMSIATSATYVITTNMRNNMSERVVVVDVWFNSATQTLDIYLYNVGKVDATVANIYLNHTKLVSASPLQLETGQEGWLNVSCTWQSRGLYYLDLVTSRGLHIAEYYNAP